ncbi:DUF3060 domain-containing protein [Marinactinospora thermotolerans]|uniref:DUF3060 domain-containing protein n=1 Tax=Marinactinospora thermotolerans DSM 45154 TaxID=1122192 RepID=A0A1T4KPS1_9ACTN|nr:DUF3060 domain-containing protein [Marinactinospora thermotolerans]SJZ44401.1 Protein of unknown function [Marinactinospora thermotolerans DSM 45154]
MRRRIATVVGATALLALFGAGCGVSVSEEGVSVSGENGEVTLREDGVSVSGDEGGGVSVGEEGGLSVSDGQTLTIASDGQNTTEDCAGRDVSVVASGAVVTLNGQCGSVSVTGNENEVHVGTADSVRMTGAENTVHYASGEPEVTNTGINNTAAQGGDATP